MRTHTKVIARMLVLVAAGWFAGCNNSMEDGTNVVLEVGTLVVPAVTATNVGGCLFTVTQSTATLNNKPKNHLSGTDVAPYNDIVLQTLHVDYIWDDGFGITAADFFLAGTVPAGGTLSVMFSDVNLSALDLSRGGHTANMTLTFKGHTVAGEAVSAVAGAALNINSCPPTP